MERAIRSVSAVGARAARARVDALARLAEFAGWPAGEAEERAGRLRGIGRITLDFHPD